jgi:DNA-directed RNA polymerase specialized sigma24 family protein
VSAAKSIHKEPTDLVHHTYLRILRLKGVKMETMMDYPYSYFRRSMYVEATVGKFKTDYYLSSFEAHNLTADYDLSHAFMLENFQLAVDRLSWFDGKVLTLYCQGFNLTQVARESGIKPTIFHTSLFRSREKLKIYFAALEGSSP